MATPAKKAAATKAAPAKTSAKTPAKVAAPAKKASAKEAKAPAPKSAAKKVPAPKASPPPAKTVEPTPTKAAAPATPVHAEAAPVKAVPAKKAVTPGRPVPATPQGGAFDAKFLEQQRKLLLEERAKLLGQAKSLEDEAAQLMEDLDPGDVQFDDESGEGDSIVVERERDLALSQQARQMIADIDAALLRVEDGTYGYSHLSGRPIPRERLRAIAWATELVEEKVGGLGRR
jgi:RNA polymerase-binding transcription factor DksA